MAMPTMVDASAALATVRMKWGAHIPAPLKARKVNDIVIFASESQYKSAFRAAYETVFGPANRLDKNVVDIIDYIPGFVTPTRSHATRRIYISPAMGNYDTDQQRMIISHEYIHWLSHPSFYPIYYKVGGDHPFQVEGVTQWLTVEAGYRTEHSQVGAYVREHLKTDAWVRGNALNQGRMLQFIFQGVATDLSRIRP